MFPVGQVFPDSPGSPITPPAQVCSEVLPPLPGVSQRCLRWDRPPWASVSTSARGSGLHREVSSTTGARVPARLSEPESPAKRELGHLDAETPRVFTGETRRSRCRHIQAWLCEGLVCYGNAP